MLDHYPCGKILQISSRNIMSHQIIWINVAWKYFKNNWWSAMGMLQRFILVLLNSFIVCCSQVTLVHLDTFPSSFSTIGPTFPKKNLVNFQIMLAKKINCTKVFFGKKNYKCHHSLKKKNHMSPYSNND
jgi:hypothetical protein